MRGDNGAAVWWLVPHRPAGPGWEEEEEEEAGGTGVRRDVRSGGGKRGTQRRRGRWHRLMEKK